VIIADYHVSALAAWAKRIGLYGVCVEHFLLSAQLLASLRQAGLTVSTDTVNHPELLAPLLPLSVDAITSDCPHQLRAAAAAPPIAA
jgi:hypothetical protein